VVQINRSSVQYNNLPSLAFDFYYTHECGVRVSVCICVWQSVMVAANTFWCCR